MTRTISATTMFSSVDRTFFGRWRVSWCSTFMSGRVGPLRRLCAQAISSRLPRTPDTRPWWSWSRSARPSPSLRRISMGFTGQRAVRGWLSFTAPIEQPRARHAETSSRKRRSCANGRRCPRPKGWPGGWPTTALFPSAKSASTEFSRPT